MLEQLTGFTKEWHMDEVRSLRTDDATMKTYLDETLERSRVVAAAIGESELNLQNKVLVSAGEPGFQRQPFRFSFKDGFFSNNETENIASGLITHVSFCVSGAAAAENQYLREEDRYFPRHFVQRKAMMFLEDIINVQAG